MSKAEVDEVGSPPEVGAESFGQLAEAKIVDETYA